MRSELSIGRLEARKFTHESCKILCHLFFVLCSDWPIQDPVLTGVEPIKKHHNRKDQYLFVLFSGACPGRGPCAQNRSEEFREYSLPCC